MTTALTPEQVEKQEQHKLELQQRANFIQSKVDQILATAEFHREVAAFLTAYKLLALQQKTPQLNYFSYDSGSANITFYNEEQTMYLQIFMYANGAVEMHYNTPDAPMTYETNLQNFLKYLTEMMNGHD